MSNVPEVVLPVAVCHCDHDSWALRYAPLGVEPAEHGFAIWTRPPGSEEPRYNHFVLATCSLRPDAELLAAAPVLLGALQVAHRALSRHAPHCRREIGIAEHLLRKFACLGEEPFAPKA